MLIDFFYSLRSAKLLISLKEYLTLLRTLKAQVIGPSIDEFYFAQFYFARMTLIKDEKYFDKFDQAFGTYFHGIAALDEDAFNVYRSSGSRNDWSGISRPRKNAR